MPEMLCWAVHPHLGPGRVLQVLLRQVPGQGGPVGVRPVPRDEDHGVPRGHHGDGVRVPPGLLRAGGHRRERKLRVLAVPRRHDLRGGLPPRGLDPPRQPQPLHGGGIGVSRAEARVLLEREGSAHGLQVHRRGQLPRRPAWILRRAAQVRRHRLREVHGRLLRGQCQAVQRVLGPREHGVHHPGDPRGLHLPRLARGRHQQEPRDAGARHAAHRDHGRADVHHGPGRGDLLAAVHHVGGAAEVGLRRDGAPVVRPEGPAGGVLRGHGRPAEVLPPAVHRPVLINHHRIHADHQEVCPRPDGRCLCGVRQHGGGLAEDRVHVGRAVLPPSPHLLRPSHWALVLHGQQPLDAVLHRPDPRRHDDCRRVRLHDRGGPLRNSSGLRHLEVPGGAEERLPRVRAQAAHVAVHFLPVQRELPLVRRRAAAARNRHLHRAGGHPRQRPRPAPADVRRHLDFPRLAVVLEALAGSAGQRGRRRPFDHLGDDPHLRQPVDEHRPLDEPRGGHHGDHHLRLPVHHHPRRLRLRTLHALHAEEGLPQLHLAPQGRRLGAGPLHPAVHHQPYEPPGLHR
mmetsp:Transcript_65238/g.199552  ORF Transcript_65238/g.199552 Transcript_65238/m.199552 type:complete len:568 (-) Transcript_65238:1210-2913(-)